MRLVVLAVMCSAVVPAVAHTAPERIRAPLHQRATRPKPAKAVPPPSVVASWRAVERSTRVDVAPAPDVVCPDCAANPADLLLPGGFAHASVRLYRQAVALQTVQMGDATTLRFEGVWPLSLQFKTSF